MHFPVTSLVSHCPHKTVASYQLHPPSWRLKRPTARFREAPFQALHPTAKNAFWSIGRCRPTCKLEQHNSRSRSIPTKTATADANRSNNDASISVFIGRAPNASLVVDEGKYTFENITLNATQSFDIDGGDVDCRFEIESRAGLIDVIEAPDCWTQWNWSNSGSWSVKVLVIDEELDTDEMVVDVVVLNRAPTFNLTHPASVEVESPITLEAVDIEDIDTSSPTGQQVSISWPGLECDEGLTQPTCTFTPMFEGPMNITAVATDDDGTTTTLTSEVMVLNVAPTLSAPSLFKGGKRSCRTKTELGT